MRTRLRKEEGKREGKEGRTRKGREGKERKGKHENKHQLMMNGASLLSLNRGFTNLKNS